MAALLQELLRTAYVAAKEAVDPMYKLLRPNNLVVVDRMGSVEASEGVAAICSLGAVVLALLRAEVGS